LGFWLIRGSALGPISGLSTASAQLSLRRLTALCPVEKRREEKRREEKRREEKRRERGHQIHQTSTHLTIMCGVQCFRHFTNFTQSPVPLRS